MNYHWECIKPKKKTRCPFRHEKIMWVEAACLFFWPSRSNLTLDFPSTKFSLSVVTDSRVLHNVNMCTVLVPYVKVWNWVKVALKMLGHLLCSRLFFYVSNKKYLSNNLTSLWTKMWILLSLLSWDVDEFCYSAIMCCTILYCSCCFVPPM